MVSLLSGAAVVLQFLAAAMGQSSQAAQDDRPHVPTERVEVYLAQLDVVVRDGAGKVVTGLARGDFTVTEAGSPLEVVAVDEWGAASAGPGAAAPSPPPADLEPEPSPLASDERPAPPPAPHVEPRSMLVLFDGLNTTSALKLNQVKRAAMEFVRRDFRAGDLAAVYQLDMALRPVCGFSPDPEEVARAIHKIAWMPASSFSDQVVENVAGYRSRAGIDYVESRLVRGSYVATQVLDWQREHTYASLTSLGEVFQGLPGRRILVYLSAGFPMTTPGDIQRESGGFTLKFRELIRTLSQTGVTVYTVDVGEDLTMGDVSRPIDWRVAIGKLGLDESFLTDLGLDPDLSTGSAGARRQSLGVLAGETGGRLLTHSDFRRAFDVIQEETTSFYRISYRVSPAEATRYRKIVVEVRRPGLKVSTRRGRFGDSVPGGGTATGASAEHKATSFRSISVTGSTTVLPVSRREGTLPLVVVAEALGPLDYPADSQGGARIDLDFMVVARLADEVVARYSRELTATIKPEGVEDVRRAFRLEGRLDLSPGTFEVQTIVRINDPPQYGIWTTTVHVPSAPAVRGPLRLAGLFLSPPAASTSPLLSALERDPTLPDPLQIQDGIRLLPTTRNEYPSPGELLALFWLTGLDVPEGEKPQVEIDVHVQDSAGEMREVPSRLLYFMPQPAGGHVGLVNVDLTPLADGAYVLRLDAHRPTGSDPSSEARSLFRVVRADRSSAGAAARPAS